MRNFKANPLSLCSENLVTGPFGVPDHQITASSTLKPASPNQYTGPERSRLNTTAEQLMNGTYLYGAWSANVNTKKEYIQVEFNDVSLVRGIFTQGRNLLPSDTTTPEYLALYRVAVSNDGVTWTPIKDNNGREKFFRGNIDTDTIEYNELPCAQLAKFVRIYPEAWSQQVSLRFDVKGCQIDTNPPQAPTTAPTTTTMSSTTSSQTSNQQQGSTTAMMSSTTTTMSSVTSSQTTNQQQGSTTAMMSSTTIPSPTTTTGSGASVAPLIGGNTNCIKTDTDCKGKMGDFKACHKCDHYITCLYGIAYLRPCPPGLEWNENTKACDGPFVANCKVQP